jgi:hypothetical protein
MLLGLLCANGCFLEPDRPLMDALPDMMPDTANNIVFVTSTTIVPGSLGATGDPLVAADAMCMKRAQDAGLSGNYVAWLSTVAPVTINAKDRIASARGWVRRDGKPFVDTVDDLVAGTIFYPPVLDEHGTFLNVAVATGTMDTGLLDSPARTCNSYTSTAASDSITQGHSSGTTISWTADVPMAACDQPMPIYCFGIDHVTPIAKPMEPGKLAFLTDGDWPSGGGITAADAMCNAEAQAQNITGRTFAALLGYEFVSPTSRFSTGPWVRRDGALVTTDLTTWIAPLNVTATTMYRRELVWTGAATVTTAPDASTYVSDSCFSWLTAGLIGTGRVSVAGYILPAGFGVVGADYCYAAHRLYCLEE